MEEEESLGIHGHEDVVLKLGDEAAHYFRSLLLAIACWGPLKLNVVCLQVGAKTRKSENDLRCLIEDPSVWMTRSPINILVSQNWKSIHLQQFIKGNKYIL